MVTTAGKVAAVVSNPLSTSRVATARPSAMASLDTKVACAQPKNAASICPTWLQSSSIACLPMITNLASSRLVAAAKIFATAKGCNSVSQATRIPRSAPIAIAVRMVSWQRASPREIATTSSAVPLSRKRRASSTAISSNGFIDILTLDVSIPSPVTRIVTYGSTTRLTGTRSFISYSQPDSCAERPRRAPAVPR